MSRVTGLLIVWTPVIALVAFCLGHARGRYGHVCPDRPLYPGPAAPPVEVEIVAWGDVHPEDLPDHSTDLMIVRADSPSEVFEAARRGMVSRRVPPHPPIPSGEYWTSDRH
jgi:hypothetical protein